MKYYLIDLCNNYANSTKPYIDYRQKLGSFYTHIMYSSSLYIIKYHKSRLIKELSTCDNSVPKYQFKIKIVK
jgi:hypothetical protein